MKELTRRDFMKGMMVGGAALGSAGLLAACGSSSSSASETEETGASTVEESASTEETSTAEPVEEEIEKPEKITIMVDGTVFTEENGRDEFFAKLTELTGIEYEVIQPDHSAYYDVLGQTIAGGDWPDVFVMSSTYYAAYAQEGVLWDMTQAYENSELKERVDAAGSTSVIDGIRIDGNLYGITLTRGNGCVTYIKQAWLDSVGMDAPTDYDEYIDMLRAFSTLDPDGNGTAGDTYGVAAAGLVGSDAPYVNYLPEFYQDAYPSFRQLDDGTWVDGFEQDSMKEALERLADAYAEGLIDPTSLTNTTSDCRNKFYSDEFGVFSYWAGTWCENLSSNLTNNGLDGELVALEPIAELDYYYDRTPGGWGISTQCENPEGVFKYFIEALLDGGDVEFLWSYGVEDVHWSTRAETLFEGTDQEVTYEEGEFHMCESLETPGTQYTKANIDQMIAIVPLEDDPLADSVSERARAAQDMFNANCQTVPMVPSSDEMTQYNGDLTTLKNELIAQVITGQTTLDEAYSRYESEGGTEWSKLIVDSLNAV